MAQFDPSQWEPVGPAVPPNVQFENISDEDRQRVLSQLNTLPVDLSQPTPSKQFDPAKWEPVALPPPGVSAAPRPAPANDYQKRVQTFREATKRGLPIPDPKAALFGNVTDEGGQWAGGPLGAGLEAVGQFAAAPVQALSQALQPLIPFPGIIKPALGALDQWIASVTGTQPPAPVPMETKDMGVLNPMPQLAQDIFQVAHEGAQKIGLGKEFEAITSMAPMHGPAGWMTQAAPAAVRQMMPRAAKGPPKPPPTRGPQGWSDDLSPEPAFVQDLPKGPPPAPKAPPPEPAPVAEAGSASVEAPPAPGVRMGRDLKPNKPGPDLNDTNVMNKLALQELNKGKEAGGWSPEDITSVPSDVSSYGGVRPFPNDPTKDIHRTSHELALDEAHRLYPDLNIPDGQKLIAVQTPAGVGRMTVEQLSKILEPKELESQLRHLRANEETSANFPPPVREATAPEAAKPPPPVEPQGASVPFFITNAQKRKLGDLGYTPDQIYKMKPGDAHEILAKGAPVVEPLKPPAIAPESPITSTAVQGDLIPEPVAKAPPGAKAPPRARRSRAQPEENLSLSQWTKANGGAPARELKGEARRLMRDKNIPGMWSNNTDHSLNELAEMAHAQGFIDTPETPAYLAALRNDLTGKPVFSQHSEGFQSGVEQQSKAEFKKQNLSAVFDVIDQSTTADVEHLVSLMQSDSPAVAVAAERKVRELFPQLAKEVEAEKPPTPTPESALSARDEMRGMLGGKKPPAKERTPEEVRAWEPSQAMTDLQKSENPAVRKAADKVLFEKTPAGEQGVIGDLPQRRVPTGATKGKRKQTEKPTALEEVVTKAEDEANQFVFTDTNSVYSPEELEALRQAIKGGPRGGVSVDGPLFIKGKELRDLEYKYAKAITDQLAVDPTGGDVSRLTHAKVAVNVGTRTESLLPASLVMRGVPSGEKFLMVIDEHPDLQRGIRNYLRETAQDTFTPIVNKDVWKLLDMPGARAWAEDHIQFGPNTGGGWQRTDVKLKKEIADLQRQGDAKSAVEAKRLQKELRTYEQRAALAGQTFESLTDAEQTQYLTARSWFDRNISEPMGFDPYDGISDYFPRMREFIETGKTIEIRVGKGRIPKTLADSVSQKVLGWMERPRTADAPAEHYDLDAIYGLINGVSRRIALSGGMDPRFGTPIEGMLKRLNPVLESLAKEEPALIPYVKRMIERVLGHAERPESPMTDLILQTQALRTMGGRLMPIVKNHFQKLNTFADVGPKAFFQGFRDMYDPKRLAIAKAAGADFSEGALLADLDMVKEGDTWVHKRGRDVRQINDYAMWGMKWSEESNQVHAFLSALRKGEEVYGEASPKAIRFARMSQSRTQFGRPSSMIEAAQTSNPGRVGFQLKRYTLAQFDFMQNQLKDPVKAARFLGGMMLLYGADGFHIGWDDEIRKHLWKKWPGGIFGAMGTAISDDVSIFPSDAVRSFGFFMPGPFAANFFDALSATTGKSMNPFEKMNVGSELSPEQRMSKGVRAFTPAGVWLNAARKLIVDLKSVNKNRGNLLEPVDASEAIGWNPASGAKRAPRSKTELFGSFLGIQSAKASDEFDRSKELGDIRQQEIRTKQQAADLYVSSRIAAGRGDRERANSLMLESRQLIKDFNTEHKGARIKLTGELVKEAQKRRRFTPAERQRQSLPKDIRGIEEAQPPPEK